MFSFLRNCQIRPIFGFPALSEMSDRDGSPQVSSSVLWPLPSLVGTGSESHTYPWSLSPLLSSPAPGPGPRVSGPRPSRFPQPGVPAPTVLPHESPAAPVTNDHRLGGSKQREILEGRSQSGSLGAKHRHGQGWFFPEAPGQKGSLRFPVSGGGTGSAATWPSLGVRPPSVPFTQGPL